MNDDFFPIHSINERSRWDLIYQIQDLSPVLQTIDSDELYRLLFNIPNALFIGIGFRDPKELRSQFGERSTSPDVVLKYTQMLLDGVEFDPVFVCNDQFVDGGHRVEAYINAAKPLIPIINLSPLYSVDWQDWLDNP